jgi:hypothetical protein
MKIAEIIKKIVQNIILPELITIKKENEDIKGQGKRTLNF